MILSFWLCNEYSIEFFKTPQLISFYLFRRHIDSRLVLSNWSQKLGSLEKNTYEKVINDGKRRVFIKTNSSSTWNYKETLNNTEKTLSTQTWEFLLIQDLTSNQKIYVD
jgi:hypothetical protein